LFASVYLFQIFHPLDINNYLLVIVIAVIGLSDSLDGIVARKFNMVSELGIILDPFVDRTVFILLVIWLQDIFPNIFFIALIVREILVLLGGIYVLLSKKPIEVSKKGKLATVFMFITICLYVLDISLSTGLINFIAFPVMIFYYFVALEYLYYLVFNYEQ
ncbi:CDP-alcohol phosphatidyltransferase family protein, partial [Candidatus Actinomarina sp.]|nr:CDP-alcohol phosphatidyltransferase family protein [Candidatus Actinomarina sp.]